MARAVGALLVLTAGCAQILDADYIVVADSPPPAATNAELPILPAQPDPERVHDCEACALDRCADQHAACLASEPCRRLLDCQGRCSDPSCILKCRDRYQSFAFDDYLACVFGNSLFVPGVAEANIRCNAECGVGRNWACTGQFHWDSFYFANLETVDIRLIDVGGGAPGSGAGPLSPFGGGEEVAPCSMVAMGGPPAGDQSCSGWQSVDGYGRVTITRRSIFRTGILALRAEHQRVYYREARRANVILIGKVGLDYVLASLPGYDPHAAIVLFDTRDCLLDLDARSADRRVELGSSAPGPIRFYWTGWGAPDPTVETGPAGGFANVPAASALEIAAYRDTGLVSRKTILTADGWITAVGLLPGSAEELP